LLFGLVTRSPGIKIEQNQPQSALIVIYFGSVHFLKENRSALLECTSQVGRL